MTQPLAPRRGMPLQDLPRQTNTDHQLIDLWLHGRSQHTQRAYRADVARFLAFVATPLPTVTLGDLQAFADALEQQDLAPSSRVRTLAAIKSLVAWFHHRALATVAHVRELPS